MGAEDVGALQDSHGFCSQSAKESIGDRGVGSITRQGVANE